jgi:dTMP kinase
MGVSWAKSPLLRSVIPTMSAFSEFPGRYAERGVFVCFEGGEGAGKSTQARLLREWLLAAGYRVRLTFEPGDTPVGQQVRQIVLSPQTGVLSSSTEFLLYAADKAEHIETVVEPALAAGEVVITDRYVDSTLAYQGSGRTLELDEIEQIARWATNDLRPHVTVVLDIEPEHGLNRIGEQMRDRDRIEAESLDFHRRVRGAFLAMAKADPQHYLVLDAKAPIEELAGHIADRVRPLLTLAQQQVTT